MRILDPLEPGTCNPEDAAWARGFGLRGRGTGTGSPCWLTAYRLRTGRRAVAEGGVQALTIVEDLDVLEDGMLCPSIAEGGGVTERCRACGRARGRRRRCIGCRGRCGRSGRQRDGGSRWPSLGRCRQGSHAYGRRGRSRRPGGWGPVDHRRQVAPALPGADVGDVAHPDAVQGAAGCRSFAAPGPEPARRRAGRGLVVLESPSPAASQPSEGHQAGYTLPRAGMALPPQLLVHSWGTVRPTAFPVDGGHPLAELAVPAGMADGRPWDHW